NALKDDLAARGKFHVVDPACGSGFMLALERKRAFEGGPGSRSGFSIGGRNSQGEHACAVLRRSKLSTSGAARSCSISFSPSEGTPIRPGDTRRSSYHANSLRLLLPMKLMGNKR